MSTQKTSRKLARRALKSSRGDSNICVCPGSTRNRSSSPYRQREVSSGSVRSGGSGGAQVNLGYGTNAWADSRRASSSVSQVTIPSFTSRLLPFSDLQHLRNFLPLTVTPQLQISWNASDWKTRYLSGWTNIHANNLRGYNLSFVV